MLSFILNFLIYTIAYLYTSTVIINFYYPITAFISAIVLFICIPLAILSSIFAPLNQFSLPQHKVKIDFIGVFAFFIILFWFSIVINRVSRGCDLLVYQLPLSLLMNNSIWFPGIGKISSTMAFSNGTSVLASPFTSFNRGGLEFIPGFTIWIIYGMGIFVYLVRRKINPYISFITASMFLLTPTFFWDHYNMGTDMPTACFLALGLLSLSDKNYRDSALFFALTALFKPLGQVTYIFLALGFCLFLIYCFFTRKSQAGREAADNVKKLWDSKVIFSLILFLLVSLRLYIATGNPFYPAVAIKTPSWGIPYAETKGLMEAIKDWMAPASERLQSSPIGFLKDFFVFPKRINGGYWFSPFFLSCLVVSTYLFIKEKKYKNVSFNSWLTFSLTMILLAGWLFSVPHYRFIGGVLVFICLALFCYSVRGKPGIVFKGAIYLSLLFTLAAFCINVKGHMDSYIITMYGLSLEEAEKHMPYYRESKEIFSTVVMEDGFTYTVSKSAWCARSKPPCLNSYTIGNKDEIIERYKKYNKKFLLKTGQMLRK